MKIYKFVMMDISPGKSKLNSRSQKKQARKLFAFLEEHKCSSSQEPTCHLFVGNGGALCGVGREQLFDTFSKFGDLSNITIYPEKPYSVISYKYRESSKAAFSQLNRTQIESFTKPLHDASNQPKQFGLSKLNLAYLSELPKESVASDLSRVLPNGLILINNFVNNDEEKILLNTFAVGDANALTSGSSMKHRSVSHYGYEFLYGSNNIDRSKPLDEKIPNICNNVIDKLINQGIIDFVPDQLTVNRYLPGQGIPSHIDTHSAFEDGIVSLSLGSQTVMDFTDTNCMSCHDVRSIVLPRQSVLVMKGQGRYRWSHGISPRKFDIVDGKVIDGLPDGLTLSERQTRISLTFRKIRHTPCNCNYHEQCDSQKDSANIKTPTHENSPIYIPISNNEAQSLEDTHVTQVYNEIAEHFSGTRHSAWPKIANFVNSLPAGSFMGDVGCGNGKYLGVNDSISSFGSDRSENLALICKERGFCVIVSDIMALPYRSSCFDAVICIAVIHHMSTVERRLAAIKELTRAVRIGGKILISVWAMEQEEKSPIDGSNRVKGVMDTNREAAGLDGILEMPTESQGKEKLDGNKGEEYVEISTDTNENNERKRLEVSAGRNRFQQQDLLVPWHFKKPGVSSKTVISQSDDSNKTLHRFYHLFKEGELVSLYSELSNVNVIEEYYDRGNWCVILERKQ